VNAIKPIHETAETVTLSRVDFEALVEETEDAEDRATNLEDCLLDMKPEQSRYLLTLAETMRIIDGEYPIKVWRAKRGLSAAQMADALGLKDTDYLAMEAGGLVTASLLYTLPMCWMSSRTS
jgi:DNA-binding XRE family transcriptional regulator